MKAAAGRRGAIQVFGTDYPTPDGTAIRDYVHVVDLADAHIKALEYLETGGATAAFNLGTGVGSSVFEVLAAAERATGRPVPHELAGRRAGDPTRSFPIPPRRARSSAGRRNETGRHRCVRLGVALHPPGRLRHGILTTFSLHPAANLRFSPGVTAIGRHSLPAGVHCRLVSF